MSDELKPCPFCGGEPIMGAWDVECDNPLCEVQPTVAGQSQAEAIAAWNRRAAPAPALDDAVRMDAKRYRFLLAPGDISECDSWWTVVDWFRGTRDVSKAELDAAIDAAMGGTQEGKHG
jgi:hypothetical protein